MSDNPHQEAREGVLCAVCACQATGVGYTANHRNPPVWVCTDETCLDQSRTVFGLRQQQYNHAEAAAVAEEAREAGVEYLIQIGKTDMATMDEAEVSEFFRRIVIGYRSGLKRRFLNHEAPF